LDAQPIENHAAIGDMRTLALVTTDGSIDFLCYPDFDSPTVFARLLDQGRGGCFCLKPELPHERTIQLYLPDTNVLITRFLHESGIAELTDFMPVRDVADRSQIVRIVRTMRGKIAFDLECEPAFDYGRAAHRVTRTGRTMTFATDDGNASLRLRSSLSLGVEGRSVRGRFELRAGERAVFILDSLDEPDKADDVQSIEALADDVFRSTVDYWQKWMSRSRYAGRWRETVNRSALALKLLTSRKYGSLLAAPTFALPEQIGGERNWDYRYSWLRDSAFSIYAFIRLGYTEEATAFQKWLHERVSDDAEHGPLQPMYRVDGGKQLHEMALDHLAGYRDSRPVRVGNAAHRQLQVDIYGELLDALYLSSKYGDPVEYDTWRDVMRVVSWVSSHWNVPDEGLWEVRSGRQHFLHSRVMCWVAMDRAVRLADKRSLPGPIEKWQTTRDEIYADVFDNFWNKDLGAFVRQRGGGSLDASALLMPLMRFISPVDPRWLSTLDAIERTLVEEPLVYRYDTRRDSDGLRGAEGSFTACSFWYIECLARARRVPKARLLFEKMLGFANHVGLFSEETGANGQHLGNFPQAFTHLALISAAYALDRAISGADRQQIWR
jgi:GH15 family glucan-1,4-alpha-glucosidase